ncbi:hypothetical protein BKA69DRAFT_347163 [Paraphysoderma sedebokerense]|nr:hypothetical protein BKA69DRAFT_347163 [Paraphysoderma sedebokerense]
MPLPTDDDDLIDGVKKLKLSSKSLASLKATLEEVKNKLEKIIGVIPEGSDDADSASKKLEKGLKTLTETELAELLSEQKKEQQHVSDTKSLVSNASATMSPQTRTASLPHPHPDHVSVTNQPHLTSANLPQQSASQPQQPPAVQSQQSSHPTQYSQPQYYSPVQMAQQYGPPSSQAPPSSAAKTLPPTPAGMPMQPMPSGPYGSGII